MEARASGSGWKTEFGRWVPKAPGSASAVAYGGSRREAQRFEYSEASRAGFVELSPHPLMTGDCLYAALADDRAVRRVVHNTTKTSQGNAGNHYMEQNLLAYVAGFERPVEFELTRHQHMRPAPGRPYTVTACFKQPPAGMEAVAWQILLRVTAGRELLPDWVRQCAVRSLARLGQQLPGDEAAAPEATPAPQALPEVAASGLGSASSATLGARAPRPTLAPTSVSPRVVAEEGGGEGPASAVPPGVEGAGEEGRPLRVHEDTLESKFSAPSQVADTYAVPAGQAPSPVAARGLRLTSSPGFALPDTSQDTPRRPALPEPGAEAPAPLLASAQAGPLVAAALEQGGGPDSASPPPAAATEDAEEGDRPVEGHEDTFEPNWDTPPPDTGAELADDAKAELQEAAGVDEATSRQRRVDQATMFLEFSSVGSRAPWFVEIVRRQGMAERPDTELARSIQANVVEHVRWRATCSAPVDAESAGWVQHIRAVLHAGNAVALQAGGRAPDLRDMVSDRVPAPGPASVTEAPVPPGDFLKAAGRRSLQVTEFHSEPKPGETDRRPAMWQEYSVLLRELPHNTHQKLPQEQLETTAGRARAVSQLAGGLHKGEVVELDPDRTRWILVQKAPGSAGSPAGLGAQWFCVAGGHPVGTGVHAQHWQEFGQVRGQVAVADLRAQIDLVQGRLGNAGTVRWEAYFPDWAEQRYRCVVPCAGAGDYEWVRVGPVVTLGELFMQLGKFFTAKHIYAFFRTLRIVALKRGKLSANDATPWSTTGGVAGGPLQAHRIMAPYRKEDELVAEYVDLRGLPTQYVAEKGPERMKKEAINFMHLLLLRDMTPPWVAHQFPRALPGDGLLSKFTRPSFLCWPEAGAGALFGAAVSNVLRGRADRVQKEFAGVIARPLYQCTATVGGRMCTNVASMSRFMRDPEGRPPYRCNDCADREQGVGIAPGPASASLRALWAYPMVRDPDGQPTPVRVSAPVRLLVHAPPAAWGWRAAQAEPPPRTGDLPVPTIGEVKENSRYERLYIYSEPDSAAIWFGSQSFKGVGQ